MKIKYVTPLEIAAHFTKLAKNNGNAPIDPIEAAVRAVEPFANVDFGSDTDNDGQVILFTGLRYDDEGYVVSNDVDEDQD